MGNGKTIPVSGRRIQEKVSFGTMRGIIISGATICLCIARRQVIEELINKVGQASPLVIIMSGEDASPTHGF